MHQGSERNHISILECSSDRGVGDGRGLHEIGGRKVSGGACSGLGLVSSPTSLKCGFP